MWSTPAVWKQYKKMDVLHFFLVNSPLTPLIYILFSLPLHLYTGFDIRDGHYAGRGREPPVAMSLRHAETSLPDLLGRPHLLHAVIDLSRLHQYWHALFTLMYSQRPIYINNLILTVQRLNNDQEFRFKMRKFW